MLRSLFSFGTLSTLLLVGAANADAQQARPARKPAPRQPVTATGKRSSSTTKASGANSTSAAAASTTTSAAGSAGSPNNNSDTPNTVNANGSIGSQESADGKGQGAYAAPGQPINIPSGKKTDSYDGKAPKSPGTSGRGSSTLKPGRRP